MNNAKPDLLLLAGKTACILSQAAIALGGLVLIVGIVGAALYTDSMAAEIGSEPFPPGFPRAVLAAIMALGLGIVACAFVFLGRLRRIIATVGEGDPFQPLNAARLNQMAWLTLGIQALILFAVPLGERLARFSDEPGEMDIAVDNGFDLSALLLALVLFILARVFRHGAAMRDDLEGTV